MSTVGLSRDRFCKLLTQGMASSSCLRDAMLLALALEHASLACPFFPHVPHDKWVGRVQSGSMWSALPQRKHLPRSLSLLDYSSLEGWPLDHWPDTSRLAPCSFEWLGLVLCLGLPLCVEACDALVFGFIWLIGWPRIPCKKRLLKLKGVIAHGT